MNLVYDTIIIGAGPSGISAGLELKKNNLNVVVFEKGAPGGKVNIAPRVDNYPGFKEIAGPDLAYEFYKRALKDNLVIIPEEVLHLRKNDVLFEIETDMGKYLSKTVLIASGTLERKLGFPHEDELLGKGISYCALCDGHFYKDKVVMVIGGGNAALKEAIYLSNLVKRLYLIHRRHEFRGNVKLVEELKNHDNITILTPYIPLEFKIDDDYISGIKIKNVINNDEQEIALDGIFPLVGQLANSSFIDIDGVTDEKGFIPVDKSMSSGVKGIFASGDILPRDIRQIYLAEFDGKKAASSIITYLKGESE